MSVEEALLAAGEAGAAAIWRSARRDLAGPYRLAVLARDPSVAARFAASLDGPWEVLPREVGAESLGLLDDLLGVHAVIWATPAHAPLPAAERELLGHLRTAPGLRGVALADLALLARISDDPEAEAAEVAARVARLLPEDWPLVEVLSPSEDLRAARTSEVAALLVADALTRVARRDAELTAESERLNELLAAEDEALDQVRRDATRVAAHVLAAMRRHAEQLLIDLRDLLVRVERDLPAQLDGLEDLDLARRALPHWLQHVLDGALHAGLSAWRSAVLADLAELDVDDEASHHAELLLPSLHPAPFAHHTSWGRRLALTAALGGAALLAAAGLWLPSLLAMSSGIAWSSWSGSQEDEASREALITAARDALRQLGEQAERVLSEQLDAMAAELDELGDERTDAAREARRGFREDLQAAATQVSRHRDELAAMRATLEEVA
ncbi:MAG: hypothetical protein EP330_24265 [Deltaproteobacteria bacterium]|nr:MAG: hypothetical protein EP330_24265 [Deltaproteobacteria bacterium]